VRPQNFLFFLSTDYLQQHHTRESATSASFFTTSTPPMELVSQTNAVYAVKMLGRILCAPVTISPTFRSSQGCMAVSIDTCTALARFIGHFWRHTLARVGVPPGFCKPPMRTRENRHPWTRVRVVTGTGAGYSLLLWKTPG
jgi:hypothetical protein